jgi:hypothetical protein
VPRAEPLLALRPLASYRTAIAVEAATSPSQFVLESVKPNRLGAPTGSPRSTTFTELIVAGGGALEYTFAGEVNWIAGANDRATATPL